MSSLLSVNSFLTDPATVWMAIAAASFGTVFWRVLGVILDGHIDPEGAIYRWVSAVAYAMVAGLIARVLILPSAGVETLEMGLRAASLAIGLGVWWGMGRSVLGGLAAGVGTFALGVFLIG